MASDSRSHLNKATQRRVLRILLIVSVLLIGAAVPLIVSSQFRLDLAQRLDLVPGGGIEQIAGKDDDIRLIVAPIEVQRQRNLPQYRFRAIFLSRPVDEGTELISIDSGSSQTIPIDSLDFIAASADASYLLLRDSEGETTGAVLIDVSTGAVTPMPSVESVPDLPGNWDEPVWARTMGECNGYSPHARYIACFQKPALASYLAGDWELQVRVYGEVDEVAELYRGIGFRPFIGWSDDDRWLYFQNEQGLWRAEVRPELFAMDETVIAGMGRSASRGDPVSWRSNLWHGPRVVA